MQSLDCDARSGYAPFAPGGAQGLESCRTAAGMQL